MPHKCYSQNWQKSLWSEELGQKVKAKKPKHGWHLYGRTARAAATVLKDLVWYALTHFTLISKSVNLPDFIFSIFKFILKTLRLCPLEGQTQKFKQVQVQRKKTFCPPANLWKTNWNQLNPGNQLKFFDTLVYSVVLGVRNAVGNLWNFQWLVWRLNCNEEIGLWWEEEIDQCSATVSGAFVWGKGRAVWNEGWVGFG